MEQQADEIAQLLRLNDTKQKGNVKIESDILEPATSSQSYATFNLARKGILSNDSRLVLGLFASNGTTRLTMMGGAYSVIKNATLRLTDSGTVIAQTTDVNYLASIFNHYKKQEERDLVGRYKNGTYNVYDYEEDTTTNINGLYGIGNMSVAGANRDQHSRDRLGTTAENRIEYVISLSELFPELFPLSLPLFAISGQVQLFLEFSEDGVTGERAVASTGNNADIGQVQIDLTHLQFISDHVFYDAPTMDQLLASTRTSMGLVIPYADFNEIVFTHVAPAEPTANNRSVVPYNRSVGLSGLQVRYMLFHNQDTAADAQPVGAQKIAGKYASLDSRAGVGGQALQIQINNNNVFNQDLLTEEFFRELEEVTGKPPSIPLPAYTSIGQVTDGTLGDGANKFALANRVMFSSDTCYSEPMTTLVGNSCVFGVNFSNPLVRGQNKGFDGVKVGNVPVQIQYRRSYTNGFARNITQRVFVCVNRVMAIKNGAIVNNFS